MHQQLSWPALELDLVLRLVLFILPSVFKETELVAKIYTQEISHKDTSYQLPRKTQMRHDWGPAS